MNIYEQDIFSQPDDIRQALAYYEAQDYAKQIRTLADKKYRAILLTGMGSSYCAAFNASTILRNHGISCVAIPTSQLLSFEKASISRDTLLVMISQSGYSGEIVELIRCLEPNIMVVGLTNDPESPLGKRADLLLPLHVQPEQAVSTRTYLAPLALMHLFAHTFAGHDPGAIFQDLYRSLDYLAQSIQKFDTLSRDMEAFLGLPPYLALIGGGYSLTTVEAGALFIKEVAKYPSIAFDPGQFRHGPFEMIGKDFAAMLFANKGIGYESRLRLAADIAARGSKVVLVSDGNDLPHDNNILVIRETYVSETLACIGNILPTQAFGNYIAKAKGLEVGTFLFSNKITTAL